MSSAFSPDQLLSQGYSCVERDDRLFDILAKADTREKGVLLWEKWTEQTVEIIRQKNHHQTHHTLPRQQVEQALRAYQKITLP